MLLEALFILFFLIALCLSAHRFFKVSSHVKQNFQALWHSMVKKASLNSEKIHFHPEKQTKTLTSEISHAGKDIHTESLSKKKRTKKTMSVESDDALPSKKTKGKTRSLPQKNTRISSGKLQKLNEEARKRKLFSTTETSGPFAFVVDRYGGVVETPFCNIIFPYGAVEKTMGITMVAKYQNEGTADDSEQISMTPEVFFTSKHEMKFVKPVEVYMQTHCRATNRRKRIPVEIERTAHRVPLKWMKYTEVKFHKGMIKFVCNQFCGFRARCDLCQVHIMSTRMCYCLSVQDTASSPESKKRVYLRVFSDTPHKHEEINREMTADCHRRIHPTQTYTVRARRNLLFRLIGKELSSSPPYHIAEVDTSILSRAFLFNLNQPATSSNCEFDVEIADISMFQKTKIQFDSSVPMPNQSSSPMHINVNGNGVGIQYNITMAENNQRTSSGRERCSAPPPYPSLPSISKDHDMITGSAVSETAETKPKKTWLTEQASFNARARNRNAISTSLLSSEFGAGIACPSAETKPMETCLTEPIHSNVEKLTSRCNSAASLCSLSSETNTIEPSSFEKKLYRKTVLQDTPSAFHKFSRIKTSNSSEIIPSTKPFSNMKKLTSRCNSAASLFSLSSDTVTLVPSSSGDKQDRMTVVQLHTPTRSFDKGGTSDSSSSVGDTKYTLGLDYKQLEINHSNSLLKNLSRNWFDFESNSDELLILKNIVEENKPHENAEESELSFSESGFDSCDGINSRNMSALNADCEFPPMVQHIQEFSEIVYHDSINSRNMSAFSADSEFSPMVHHRLSKCVESGTQTEETENISHHVQEFSESGFDSCDGINSRNMLALSADCKFSPIGNRLSKCVESGTRTKETENISHHVQEEQQPAVDKNIPQTSGKKSYSDAVKATKQKRTSRRGVSRPANYCSDAQKRLPRWRY